LKEKTEPPLHFIYK